MSLNLRLPENIILKPCITVFGIGGAGGNAVNNMISSKLEGARFVVANTDAQALEYALAERKIQLGENLTRGLGAGAAPEVGKAAAEEAMDAILDNLEGSNMVFITAGMGGGTGTGAAPIIAKVARERGILTVGVVTKPFHFEGSHRMKIAELGLIELHKYVDTLIVIPNQNLFRIATERTTFADAFKMADDVLHAGVRGVTDLMMMPGLINLDFADIRAVMSEMGKAMMGTGEAHGERRAIEAAEAAISNPLLDNSSMKGARGVLINITGGPDMTLFEVDEAANRIRDEVDVDANIIFGSTFNPDLEGTIRVSVVATGINYDFTENRANKSAFLFGNIETQAEPTLNVENLNNLAEEQTQIIDNAQEQSEDDGDVIELNEEETLIGSRDNKFPQNIIEQDYEHHPNFNSSYYQQAMQPRNEEKFSSKMSELFGRMFSSVGLGSTQAPEQPQVKVNYRPKIHDKTKVLSGNEQHKEEEYSNAELDIPTFLRRK